MEQNRPPRPRSTSGGRLPARRLGRGERRRIQRQPHRQKPESVHQEAEHLALDAHQVLASSVIPGTANQVWKQVKIVLLDHPMEAQLRVVGPAFLHDRKRNNLRVGHGHAIGSITKPDPVGRNFRVEVVDDAIENQEQLFGRDGRFGQVDFDHNSRSVVSGRMKVKTHSRPENRSCCFYLTESHASNI